MSEGMPAYLNEVLLFVGQQEGSNLEHAEDFAQLLKSLKERMKLQSSMTSVIIERIDKLRPSHQLTLKVASVLGLKVDADVIAKIYPVDQRNIMAAVTKDLQLLVEQKFLKQDPTTPHMYQFCNAVTRDIVYEVIPTY